MSTAAAGRKRAALYLSVCGLLLMVAAISGVSARDPSGTWWRVGMMAVALSGALLLPIPALLPTLVLVWLIPNLTRTLVGDVSLFTSESLLELPGIVGLAFFTILGRHCLRLLEEEDILFGMTTDDSVGIDKETGVYEERLLRPALEAELARARRFGREFGLVLVGVDEIRQKFDYRDEVDWQISLVATAKVLLSTRAHIDRVYRYGEFGFALLLPESGPREVTGLVRRLRRVARNTSPAEGEPGGPLPTHFGATFFPQAATGIDDLIRRAEVALRLAERSFNRLRLDSAAAPALPPPETFRQLQEQARTLFGSGPVDLAEWREEMETRAASQPVEPGHEGGNGVTPEPRPAAPLPIPMRAAATTQSDQNEYGPAKEAPLDREEDEKQAESELLEDKFTELLSHLDETLDLIRTMRSPPAA